jgi:hypothetical protein
VVAAGTTGSRRARNDQDFYRQNDDASSTTKAVQQLNADLNNSMFGIWKAGAPY